MIIDTRNITLSVLTWVINERNIHVRCLMSVPLCDACIIDSTEFNSKL